MYSSTKTIPTCRSQEVLMCLRQPDEWKIIENLFSLFTSNLAKYTMKTSESDGM